MLLSNEDEGEEGGAQKDHQNAYEHKVNPPPQVDVEEEISPRQSPDVTPHTSPKGGSITIPFSSQEIGTSLSNNTVKAGSLEKAGLTSPSPPNINVKMHDSHSARKLVNVKQATIMEDEVLTPTKFRAYSLPPRTLAAPPLLSIPLDIHARKTQRSSRW